MILSKYQYEHIVLLLFNATASCCSSRLALLLPTTTVINFHGLLLSSPIYKLTATMYTSHFQ